METYTPSELSSRYGWRGGRCTPTNVCWFKWKFYFHFFCKRIPAHLPHFRSMLYAISLNRKFKVIHHFFYYCKYNQLYVGRNISILYRWMSKFMDTKFSVISHKHQDKINHKISRKSPMISEQTTVVSRSPLDSGGKSNGRFFLTSQDPSSLIQRMPASQTTKHKDSPQKGSKTAVPHVTHSVHVR